MTDNKEKKFVIKHVFTDVKKAPSGNCIYGNKERHFGIPWRIYLSKYDSYCFAYLQCLQSKDTESWSIDTNIEVKMQTNTGEEVFVKNRNFFPNVNCQEQLKYQGSFDKYLVNGNLTIECHLTINKIEGIQINKLRDFSDETMKKLSDVVLVVENQKFPVNKMYLAAHSRYFESLLLGNFDESKKSEVQLKDIDPCNFQNFLEVLYGEPAIDAENVGELLKLADMYDAPTIIKRCEEFFIYKSKQELKVKFTAAVKYNMDELKKICISEMKTPNDIYSVLPQNPNDMEPVVWEELLKLCISICNEK